MQGHWIDGAILLIVGLSILTGIFRGFIKEVMALVIWALAGWLAYSYSDALAPLMETWIQEATIRKVIAFIAILLVVLLTGGILNATISYLLKRTGLNGTDRTLGVVFGFVRGICLVALMMIGAQLTSLPIEDYEKKSLLYPQFQPLVVFMRGYMPDFINKVKEADVHNQLGEAKNTFIITDG
jgi:membrane protein required for colicin V production